MSVGLDEYLEAQVLTASPERLHLLVLDAALRYARQGLAELDAGRRAEAFGALARSRACVSELLVGLNPEPNPQLVEQLRALFAYLIRNLSQAEINFKRSLVEDTLHLLELHRDAWLTLIARLQDGRVRTAPAPGDGSVANDWVT